MADTGSANGRNIFQSFRLYCRSPAPVPQTPKLVANSSLGLPLRIIAAALFLRCYGALFGRKTLGSKKRNMTATTTAAIARMKAPVANLAHMVQR